MQTSNQICQNLSAGSFIGVDFISPGEDQAVCHNSRLRGELTIHSWILGLLQVTLSIYIFFNLNLDFVLKMSMDLLDSFSACNSLYSVISQQ